MCRTNCGRCSLPSWPFTLGGNLAARKHRVWAHSSDDDCGQAAMIEVLLVEAVKHPRDKPGYASLVAHTVMLSNVADLTETLCAMPRRAGKPEVVWREAQGRCCRSWASGRNAS